MIRTAIAILSLAGLSITVPPALAQAPVTYTWTVAAAGVWSDTDNWLGGIFPAVGNADYDTTLSFAVPNGFSYSRMDLFGELKLNWMEFNNAGSTALTIGRASNDTVSVLAFGGTNSSIVQNGNGEITFYYLPTSTSATTGTALPIRLDGDVTVGGSGLGRINLDTVITGTGKLIITGGAPTLDSRVVSLGPTSSSAVPNSFGGVVLDGGNLEIGATKVDVLGGSMGNVNTLQVTANGGSLFVASSTALPGLLTNINIATGGTLTLHGSAILRLDQSATLSGSGSLKIGSSSSSTTNNALEIFSDSPFTGRIYTALPPIPSDTIYPVFPISLKGANGALRAVTDFDFTTGGGLVLDNNLADAINQDRVSDSTAIKLSGGVLTLLGGPSVNVTERVGEVRGSGFSFVYVLTGGSTGTTPTAKDTLLRAPALTRVDRGTFAIRGTNLGVAPTGGTGSGTTGRFVLDASLLGDLRGANGAAGSRNISIVPYAIGSTTTSATAASTTYTFVTYTAAHGFRPLSTATSGTVEYEPFVTATSGSSILFNYRTSSTTAVAIAGATTVNSLFLSSAPSGGITGGGSITISSGAMLVTTTTALTIAPSIVYPVNVESQMFITGSSGNVTLSSPLTGNAGLTKSGDGVLTLSAANNASLTGPLTINGGRIGFTSAAAIPGTGDITVYGLDAAGSPSTGSGIRNVASAGPVNIERNFVVKAGMFMITAGTSATAASTQLTVSGIISGVGGVSVYSYGDIVLAGNNTYAGPTVINNGTLLITSDANLGNGGAVHLAAGGSGTTLGGIKLAGNWDTSRHIEIATSRFDTNGFNATWNGPITGASILYKNGAGRLTITSSNPYDGGITFIALANSSAGMNEVRLSGNGRINSTSFTLPQFTQFTLDYTTLPSGTPTTGAVTVSRLSDGAGFTFNGDSNTHFATLKMLGNPLASVTETIGRVTALSTGGATGIVDIVSPDGVLTTLNIGNIVTGAGTLVFQGTNLGTISTNGSRIYASNLNGVELFGSQLLPGVTYQSVNSLGVVTLTRQAIYDSEVGVREIRDEDFTVGPEIRNPINQGTTPVNTNFSVTDLSTAGGPDTISVGSANTISSLNFIAGTEADLSSGILTIRTGVVFTEAGTASSRVYGGTIAAGQNTTTTVRLTFGILSNLQVDSVLTGTGGFAKLGDGTLTLTGANTVNGTVDIQKGTLVLQGSGFGGTTANAVTVRTEATFNAVNSNFAMGTVTASADSIINITGTTYSAGTQTINTGAKYTLTNSSGSTGLLTLTGSVLTLDNSTLSTFSLTGSAPSSNDPTVRLLNNSVLTVGNTGTSVYTFAGRISGNGRIVKTNTNALNFTLTGTVGSDFSGGITVEGGKLGFTSAERQLGTGPLIINGGTLSYNATDSTLTNPSILNNLGIGPNGGSVEVTSTVVRGLMLPAAYTWSRAFTKIGAGRLLLGASATSSVPLDIAAGIFDITTLDFTAPSASGAGVVNIGGGSFNTNSDSFSVGLTGTGTLVLPSGSTTVTLTGTAQTFGFLLPTDRSVVYRPLDPNGVPATGTVTVTGDQVFANGLTVLGGKVSFAAAAQANTSPVVRDSNLGTGPIMLDGGGILYTGTTEYVLTNPLTIGAAGGSLEASSTAAGAGLRIPASFAWNGTLTKAGSGRVFLGGSYTTPQTLNVAAGTFDVGTYHLNVGTLTGSATGIVNVAPGGSLTPNASTFSIDLVGGGAILLPPATTTVTFTDTTQNFGLVLPGDMAIYYNPTSATTGQPAAGVLTLSANQQTTLGVTGNPQAKYVLVHPHGAGTGPIILTQETDSSSSHLGFTFGADSVTTVANDIALSNFGGIRNTFDINSANATVILSGQITRGGPSNQFVQTVFRLLGVGSTAAAPSVYRLTNPGNSFQAILEVDIGILAVTADTFGLAENPIRLATASTASDSRGGLRFEAAFPATAPFARTIIFRDGNYIDTQSNDVVLSGPLTDSSIPPTTPGANPTIGIGTLTKVGTGTLTLANSGNTHSGLIVVSQGPLSVTGTVAAGNNAANNLVTVNAGGILMGTGTINRPINLNDGATLQGGTGLSTQTLTATGLNLDGANTVRVVVGGTPALPQASRLDFGAGIVNINTVGTAIDVTTIRLFNDGTMVFDGTPYTVTLATYGSVTGTPLPSNFNVVADNFGLDSNSYSLTIDPTRAVLTFTPTAVPEPVMILGLAGLATVFSRRLQHRINGRGGKD